MKQYLDLLQNILENGEWKSPARENMPRTKSVFGARMEFDLRKGLPLLTTKRVYWKGVITELLWFLRGDTNIKYLVESGCNIWNQDAYRWYLKKVEKYNQLDDKINPVSIDRFIEIIKNQRGEESEPIGFGQGKLSNNQSEWSYAIGDLGKVYGYQWRNQNGADQLKELINSINTNKESRYHIIDAWNKSDFKDMALPPCHLLYQFNCVKKEDSEEYYLDLQMYQRSADTFLGVPFNIASSALLLKIIAEVTNTIPRKLIWVGGDTHIYENHFEQVKEQLKRDVRSLGEIHITKELNSIKDIEDLKLSDFTVTNYNPHPVIKAELKTGL